MKTAPIPENEAERLRSLESYQILDTDPEASYDDLTQIAAEICGTPIALVSLIDVKRQWFKSRVGLDAHETHRDLAFCAHAILEEHIFEVTDASQDERFFDNPLVTEDPNIRFYAGAPLVNNEGLALGTLCVIDYVPHQLTEGQKTALNALGRQITSLMELRRQTIRLQQMNQLRDRLLALLSHDLKSSFNAVIGFSTRLKQRAKDMDTNAIVRSVSHIQQAGQRAHQLLMAILEWSAEHLEEKKHAPELVDIKQVCDDAAVMMSDLSDPKNITIQIHADEGVEVFVNRCLLNSAIQNLMSNAIKFSNENTTVTIKVEHTPTQVSVTVEDQGVGMTPEKAKKLFEGGSSSKGTAGEEGTGIGMLLVKDFVTSAHGEMTVKSEVSKGTSVSFTLPRILRENGR